MPTAELFSHPIPTFQLFEKPVRGSVGSDVSCGYMVQTDSVQLRVSIERFRRGFAASSTLRCRADAPTSAMTTGLCLDQHRRCVFIIYLRLQNNFLQQEPFRRSIGKDEARVVSFRALLRLRGHVAPTDHEPPATRR